MNPYVAGLECQAKHRTAQIDASVCDRCLWPLEVIFDYDMLKRDLTKEKIGSRKPDMWRYIELLPIGAPPPKSESVGYTELHQADSLAKRWGMEQGKLYIKFEGNNWTGTLKPRVTLVGLQKALEFGYAKIGCVSTGNLSSAVAAAGARLGLKTFVFVPANTEPNKMAEVGVYGATTISLDMNFSDISMYCSDLQETLGAKTKFAILNLQLRPYYTTGAKTLAFETSEQLGWKLPRNVVVPVAAGNTLVMAAKGFEEFSILGLAEGELPRIFGAQPAMCNPVSAAVKAGSNMPLEVIAGETIAKSLVIPRPGDGEEAIAVIKRSGGFADDASDEEVRSAIKELGQSEGLFAGTAGGVTLAVAKKMVEQGRILPNELTVVYVTDSGLRTPNSVSFSSDLIRISNAKIGNYVKLEQLLVD